MREKKCGRLFSGLDVTIIAVEHDNLKAKTLEDNSEKIAEQC